MKTIINNYMPEPHQQEIHDAIEKNRFLWVNGGFRSGKTRAFIEEDIEACHRFPGMVILITRKFHEDIKGTVKQDFYEAVDPRLIAWTEDERNICHFRNGSKVIFRGLYTRSSLQRSKLGGLNVGRVHVEEASEITLNDFLDLQGRLSLTSIPEHQRKIYCNANPPTADHWAFQMFEQGRKDGLYACLKVSTRMNAKHLPASYISDMEESYGSQPGWLSRFFDGHWGFTPKGDPVYQFSDIYVDDKLDWNRGLPIYRCWDFGWAHPAVVWMQVGVDREVNILREKLGSKIYLKNFAAEILKITNDEFPNAEIIDICDDAGKQHKDDGRPSIDILENDFHLRMRYRQSFVQEGIELIQAKMREMVGGRPAFKINGVKCPITIEGFRGGYCRDGDEIIKDGYYEHTMDCIREGFVNIFANNSVEHFATVDPKKIVIAQPIYGFNNNPIGARAI